MDDSKAKPRKSPAPGRKTRRRARAFACLVLVAVALVAGLPWLLGTPPGRALIVGQVNARLAPGSIRLDGLGLSWTGPIVLDGLALRDPKGKTVLAASRVTVERGIVGLIASRPDYGTISVEGATVDVERREDGKTDLLEALASVLKADAPAPAPAAPMPGPAVAPTPSPMAVAIVIKGGTLKLASPELVEPLAAKTLEGSVTIAPGKPIEVVANLGDEGRSLEIRSTLDPASADRSMSVVAKGWPIHVRRAGVEARGRLGGDLQARQSGGLWSAKGDAALDGVEAAGPSLQGDRIALDRVLAACEVEQSATGWAIRKFDLISPVASLQGSGTLPAVEGSPAKLRGKVDLALLAKLAPRALRVRDGVTLDRGTATIRVDVATASGLDRAEVVAGLDDFAATEDGRAIRLRQPIALTGKATRHAGKISVEALEVTAAGVDVKGSGDPEAGIKLAGTVDLPMFMTQLRDVLDLGKLDLSGHARLAADYRHAGDSFKGRFAVECKALKVGGATAEPIVREAVRLDGWAVGPAQADGLPKAWQQARLDLKAGDVKLDLQATSAGLDATLAAGFEMKVESPVPGRFDAKASIRKKGTVYEVAELIAGITPTDPKAAPGAVALAVLGKFDASTGEGTFGPIPGYAAGAIGLGPDGARVSGLGKAGVPLQVDAAMIGDLAALDRLLATWKGSPPRGLAGAWASRLFATRSASGKLDFEGSVSIPELTLAATPRGPVSMAAKGWYAPEFDRAVSSLGLTTPYGKVALLGGLAEIGGRRMMDLSGTIEPDWSTLDPIIAGAVEPGAKVRATVRPIHLAGQLQADSTPQLLNQLFGEVAIDLASADAFGVTFGPSAVVLKLGGGSARFDPIATTINGGPTSIIADLAFDDDYGVLMRIGAARIDGAAINEAVSRSLLTYVAPVMAKSSTVGGKVSMAVDRAFVPITAKSPLALDGALVFQGVTFQPGPLASELNAMTGQAMHVIRLDESMVVKVADGRVRQTGLTIPVGGNGLVIAIDGSVGFDETLDLRATAPLTAKALGLDASLDKLAGGRTVTLPIGGTIARPAIDRNALRVALRDAARGIGEQQVKSEAGRLLERIAGPNQPAGEPRSKPANRNPLGDLEDLGRQILDRKKP